MFGKNLDDITYNDIIRLQEEQIDESDILDYKEDFQKEDEIIKHVCAFANARGGYLVFGIKASKDGGHPTAIGGISNNKIRKEKIENLMLSNIVPRLDVKIKTVAMPNTENSILLVQIPDSYNKPHYNQKNNKFYKRYNFQSNEMTEQEIADSYRRRFSSHDQVEQYVNRLFKKQKTSSLVESIIVIPSNIEHRLIDTFDHTKYEWLGDISLEHSWGPRAEPHNFFPSSLQPFADGLYSESEKRRSKSRAEPRNSQTSFQYEISLYNLNGKIQRAEIHRNGCIFYTSVHEQIPYNLRSRSKDSNYYNLLPGVYAVKTMHTLQAASQIMSHYNYLGEVKIIARIVCPPNTQLFFKDNSFVRSSQNLIIHIEKMFSLQHIKTNYQEIAADVMHEVVNYFGIERCELFDTEGQWIEDC